MTAIELPAEHRWRCQKCGKDVPEAQHVPLTLGGLMRQLAGAAYALSQYCDEEPFMPLSGPAERGHEIHSTTGRRAGVIGGWTRYTSLCGPLRLTPIDTQEIFVEWVMAGGFHGGMP